MNENLPIGPTRRSDFETDTRWRAPPPPAADCPIAAQRKRQRRRLGLVVLLIIVAGLALGAWRSHAARETAVDAKQQYRDMSPTVRVAAIKAAPPMIDITLPGATLAYANADIYARANGYIEKRNVDIGDRVKTGDVLAVLTAPELDHQIAQAEAAKAQAEATIRQSDANQKLAQVTNDRSAVLVRQGWVTRQQGDNDRLNYAAQQAALGAAQASESAQNNAIKVLRQQRDYLTVVAPFDGVVTLRAVDVGALVQTGATLMFNLQQTSTIRVQVYVPQDQAFELSTGDGVDVRVPEIPGRVFPGKITRSGRRAAAGHPHLAGGSRRAQPGRRFVGGRLLPCRAAHSTQNAGDDRSRGGADLQPRRTAGRGGGRGSGAFAQGQRHP